MNQAPAAVKSPVTPRVTTVWARADSAPARETLIAAGYAEWLADLLARRGVDTADAAKAFLEPALDQLHDPLTLGGVPAAVERLLRARDRGEHVAIVGDYDVDGVTGTAQLTAVLRACGLEVLPIIPHRMKDGYGLQSSHVETVAAAGCQLLITVDCGSTAIDPVQAALDAGLDVIVTDHHLPGTPLPDAVIHINPKQEGSTYPEDELSGAGLAFKLALAVAAACERPIDPGLLLRVACLGTIADMVPLRGENRVIACLGLLELENTRSVGLGALLKVSGVKPPYDASDVGYRLGPRINAPGRLDSAQHALELMLCRDPERAEKLAQDLESWNRERQAWERQVSDEARQHFAALLKLPSSLPSILVAWRDTWHRGVVGISAGRVAREFNRPTLLLSVDGDMAVGSGRSVPGLHLHGFLSPWSDQLAKFGGHAQAVGLSVELAKLPELLAQWQAEAERQWADQVAIRVREYELELPAGELHRGTLSDMDRLKPFGQGNPRPLVRVPGPLRLLGTPRTFGRDHLSAELVDDDGDRVMVLGWGWQSRLEDLDGDIELLGHLEYDRYRGRTVLRLVDARRATREPEKTPVGAP